MITRELFDDWKRHPVTLAIMSEIVDRTNQIAKELLVNAGTNPMHDRYLVGISQGYAALLDINLEDMEDNSESNSMRPQGLGTARKD